MSILGEGDLQRQIDELHSRVGSLESVVNHLRERAEVKYTDYNVRIENLENVRIGFYAAIFGALVVNVLIGAYVVYLLTK